MLVKHCRLWGTAPTETLLQERTCYPTVEKADSRESSEVGSLSDVAKGWPRQVTECGGTLQATLAPELPAEMTKGNLNEVQLFPWIPPLSSFPDFYKISDTPNCISACASVDSYKWRSGIGARVWSRVVHSPWSVENSEHSHQRGCFCVEPRNKRSSSLGMNFDQLQLLTIRQGRMK